MGIACIAAAAANFHVEISGGAVEGCEWKCKSVVQVRALQKKHFEQKRAGLEKLRGQTQREVREEQGHGHLRWRANKTAKKKVKRIGGMRAVNVRGVLTGSGESCKDCARVQVLVGTCPLCARWDDAKCKLTCAALLTPSA